MRRNILPIVFLLAAGLAGCLASQGSVGGPPAGEPSLAGTDDGPGKMMKVGCRETFVSLEVPASQVADDLPDGFDPVPPPGLSVGLRPTAWFVMVSAHCEATEAGDETIEDAQSMWYAIAVDPPNRYKYANRFVYFYPLKIAVGDPAQAAILSDWHLPVETGDLTLDAAVEADQAWAWQVGAETGNVSYSLQATAAGRGPMHDITVRLVHEGVDGNDTAVDLSTQGNTFVSTVGSFTFDLDAPGSPFPGPLAGPPYGTSNVKVTPPGEDSLRWRHRDV